MAHPRRMNRMIVALGAAVVVLGGFSLYAVNQGARFGPRQTTPAERAFAERVLAAVAEVTGLSTPLYGRIDLVDSAEHGLALLEAELFEPTYNLHLVPEVTELFADAILSRL